LLFINIIYSIDNTYHYLYISVNTFTDNYHNNTWQYHDS
jgi:hypothetical protein